MAIDNCQHTFTKLVTDVLPNYMARLREQMKSPMQMQDFAREGVGVRSLLQRLGREDDFSGCYVLLDGTAPIYAGISRGVVARLRQHVRGTTHFDASLAYRVAFSIHKHELTRSAAMELQEFKQHFQASQEYLKTLNVTFIEIDNPLELHIFETYAAMEFDTSVWNTFATH